MTLLSKFLVRLRNFRIPRNEESFLQYMEARRIPGLDISLGTSSRHYYFGSLELQGYYPVLCANGKKLELKGLAQLCTAKNSHIGDRERLMTQGEVFDRMLKLASYYKERGLQVTINGRPVEEEERTFKDSFSKQMASLG